MNEIMGRKILTEYIRNIPTNSDEFTYNKDCIESNDSIYLANIWLCSSLKTYIEPEDIRILSYIVTQVKNDTITYRETLAIWALYFNVLDTEQQQSIKNSIQELLNRHQETVDRRTEYIGVFSYIRDITEFNISDAILF